MFSCFRNRCRTWLVVALLVAGQTLWVNRATADDKPDGRIISEVLVASVGIGGSPPIRTGDQIRGIMHTRPGAPYEEATVLEDIRRLDATKWFVPGTVRILTKNDPDGRVPVIVLVSELPNEVEEVRYLGAQHLRNKELQALTGIQKGDPLIPRDNELGRQAILRKYREEGRYYASVELIEGNHPDDTRVIYKIVEGPVVKVDGIDFSGVNSVSVGRLRKVLASKNGPGGKFNPTTIDLDRQKLIEYFHLIGFSNVEISSEVVQTSRVGHVRIRYHVTEGQRLELPGRPERVRP